MSADDIDESGDSGPSWLSDFAHPLEGRGERDLSVMVEQRAASNGDPEGTTLFVASTDDEDRALDIVKQDWYLKDFRANGPILDNHNPYRVVGRGIESKVPRAGDDAGQLMIRVRWATDAPDPSIATVGWQHLNGFRSAGSVGFRFKKKTSRDKLDPTSKYFRQPQKMTVASMFGDFDVEHAGFLYEGNILLEHSSATIPMNPNALQRSLLIELGHLDPADAVGRARLVGETVPRSVGADLVSMVRGLDDAGRGQLIDLLWPDWLQRMRTDPTARRIMQALQIPAGPPAQSPTPFLALVRQAQERSR